MSRRSLNNGQKSFAILVPITTNANANGGEGLAHHVHPVGTTHSRPQWIRPQWQLVKHGKRSLFHEAFTVP